MLERIKKHYVEARIEFVDKDFLEFEEESIKKEDLEKILSILDSWPLGEYPNPHNSIILYLTGISNDFDFKKGRSDMTGGSPPDIDMDFQPSGKDKIVKWLIEKRGRENVAHIGAYGTFGLKSIARDISRIHEPLEPKKTSYETVELYEEAVKVAASKKRKIKEDLDTLLKVIPEPAHGIAPDFKKLLEEHPKLEQEHPLYTNIAGYADGMRKQLGIHAAGIVISDMPLHDHLPIWKNDKAERITQFDKIEVEDLGFLKMDFLVIDSLDTIAETLKYVKETHNQDISLDYIYTTDDPKAYKLIGNGHLVGLWQMEGGGTALVLSQRIKPKTIGQLSDISSLNRPGPLQAGFDKLYIENMNNNLIPEDMPEMIRAILKETNYVIIYQEQIMRIVSDVADFTLREADDVRKAMGKKDRPKLEKIKPKFMNGAKNKNIGEVYLEKLWTDMVGFAEYSFNLSHSCSYAHVTYATAWLKANYPVEFYRAFLTIKSQELSPEDFQEKLKEVISECKQFGIEIKPPDINHSKIGFSPDNGILYFGLAGIKTIAKSSADSIINARKKGPFIDVWDFLSRVDRGKLNCGKFKALAKAGCFDKLGYTRKELFDKTEEIYEWFVSVEEAALRVKESAEREIQRADAESKGERKMPALKLKEVSEKPELKRSAKIILTADDLREQAEYIGCYLSVHPSEIVKGNFTHISKLSIGEAAIICGIVSAIKVIKDKNGKEMAFIKIEDKSAICEATVFSSYWSKVKDITVNSLIKAKVKPNSESPIKVILNELTLVESE